jgi:cell division protease FtsH
MFIFYLFFIGLANSFVIRGNIKLCKPTLFMKDDDVIPDVIKNQKLLPNINYNRLIEKMNNHEISKIYFDNRLDKVIAENEDIDGNIVDDYSITEINPFVTNSLVTKAIDNKVETFFLKEPSVGGVDLIAKNLGSFFEGYILPFLFLSFIVSIFQSGSMSGGIPMLSGSKDIDVDKLNMIKANISLSSFAGSPEIFEECFEVVSYLKNDTNYKLAGAEIPRGILLEGPPGTGKTLLAKAIASEADANFISIPASEFIEMFVGLGAARIRSLFKKARENTPCILFIDEIDAIGRQRGTGINMGNDEREQTLNQLLAEMDGFADNDGVLIIAATNRKDVLDSALLRPGRFDRIITVPLPDVESRKEIFKVHSQNKFLNDDVNFDFVADLTNGFSGAQIKNLLNEAAIFAARRNETIIQEDDIVNSIDKLLVGLVKKNDTRSAEAIERVTIHENGHATLVKTFSEYFELKKVSIKSTYNGAAGYTLFNEHRNISESGLYTKDFFKKRLIIALGGKAAEFIHYGDLHVSAGAIQDLKEANSLAKRMVGNYGMGKELQVFYNEDIDSEATPFVGKNFGGNKYSDKTREIFDRECLDLVNEAYAEAIRLLLEK